MRSLAALTLTIAATATTAGAQTFTPNLNNVELGLNAGYQQGLSGGLTLRAANIAGPIGIRVGIDYSNVTDSLNDNVAYLPGALDRHAGPVAVHGNGDHVIRPHEARDLRPRSRGGRTTTWALTTGKTLKYTGDFLRELSWRVSTLPP